MTRRWHARVGVVASVLVLVVAVTGGILSFRHWIGPEEPVSPGPAAGPVLTIDEALAAARRHAAVETRVAEIYLANDPDGTWCVVFDDDDATEVYMTADGTLLEVVVPRSGLTQWLFRIHTGEVLGPVGPWLGAGVGAAMVWLAGSGLAMWRPRKRP